LPYSSCCDLLEQSSVAADTLPAFRRVVGGYIEQVSSEDRRISFWLNENRNIEDLPVNELATQLSWATHPFMTGS
jgi:hypothetical protein